MYVLVLPRTRFLDIQATIEFGFTLKRVRDMTKTYSHFKSLLFIKIFVSYFFLSIKSIDIITY